MKKYKAGVMITGSQKALACPPGVSVIVLYTHMPYSSFNIVKILYAGTETGWRAVTAFDIDLDIYSNGKPVILLLKYLAKAEAGLWYFN